MDNNTNNIDKYISLEEFSNICGKSQSTIKKRIHTIPRIEENNGTYLVLRGTRYPVNLRRFKANDFEKNAINY